MLVDADDFGRTEIPSFNVTIKVTEVSNNKPVSHAVVAIFGAEGGGSAYTGKDGIATVYVANAVLEENIQQEYMRIEVFAKGYYLYRDEYGIKLVRV